MKDNIRTDEELISIATEGGSVVKSRLTIEERKRIVALVYKGAVKDIKYEGDCVIITPHKSVQTITIK